MTRMLRRLNFWPVLVLNACATTPKVWTAGFPRSGASMTNDQRLEQYSKFIPSQVHGDFVTVLEGKEDVRYSISSYKPVFRALDPKIESHLNPLEKNERYSLYAAGATAVLSAEAYRPNLDKRQRYSAIAGAVIAFGLQRLYAWWAADERDAVMSAMRTALDKRLFPQ